MKCEDEFVKWLQRRCPQQPVPDLGIGDDAAVLTPPPGKQLVISADALTENVHFKRKLVPSTLLGRKALLVNLSDLAAMGAEPWFCLLALGIPRSLVSSDYLSRLADGFVEEAGRWNVPLIGGNLSRCAVVQISVTIGGLVDAGQAVTRSGCRPGDSLYAVGELGLSCAGLGGLRVPQRAPLPATEEEIRIQEKDPWLAACLIRHLLPTPHVEAGLWLRKGAVANSMIDISDGLVRDLQRIGEASNVDIILSAACLELLRGRGGERMTLRNVLYGGEDYALVFSSDWQEDRIRARFPNRLGPLQRIGIARPSAHPAVLLDDGTACRRLDPKGFDHFK